MKPPQKPSRFQLIFLSSFMKPQMVSSFMVKNIRETTKTIKKKEWKQVTQKKERFPFKTIFVPSPRWFQAILKVFLGKVFFV